VLTETSRGTTKRITPATVLFLPAGEVHACRFLDAGARVFSIFLHSAWMERLRELSLPLDAPVIVPGGPLSGLALRLHREAGEHDVPSALVMEGLALELLGGLGRSCLPPEERQAPPWLRQAHDLLQDRFAESLSLDEIALAVGGVHPVYLAGAFRARYGCTIGDFVRRRRIEYACREIAGTDTSLIEIALDAGFANQSHFTRVFKRQMGVTPARYRRAFSSP
jgi:AraC-like DNA-binding protein